jgi:hypothetical protein
MPMKLNLGLMRKVGEPNYGSPGASVNIELEVDPDLASDAAKLHQRIRGVYAQIRESLDQELHTNGTASGHSLPRADSTPPVQPSAPARNGAAQNGDARPATRAQVTAIFAIAKQQKIDLHALLKARFHVYRADDLSVGAASRLIDELNADPAGRQRHSA